MKNEKFDRFSHGVLFVHKLQNICFILKLYLIFYLLGNAICHAFLVQQKTFQCRILKIRFLLKNTILKLPKFKNSKILFLKYLNIVALSPINIK